MQLTCTSASVLSGLQEEDVKTTLEVKIGNSSFSCNQSSGINLMRKVDGRGEFTIKLQVDVS